jgi:hypothetical protein
MIFIKKSGSTVSTTGLAMPPEFPFEEYQAVNSKLGSYASNKQVYDEFIGAWNAITYRFLAFAQADERFTASIARHGAGPPAEERYRQERDLFEFFSNGFSTFESFFYGVFAAGALLRAQQFPIITPQDRRRITSASTLAGYCAAFPRDSFTNQLANMTTDALYLEIREIRNILAHRSAPGRTLHVAIGDDPAPDQWKLADIVLDNMTTSVRRKKACQVFAAAMESFQRFCESNF